MHISEMSTHHVDSPEQVVTPGEELWVKIIDLDLARRRISLSIKQAAEGGELAEEYREHFEVDEHGNWTAGDTDAEREAAWSEYYGDEGAEPSRRRRPPTADEADGRSTAEAEADDVAADDAPVDPARPTPTDADDRPPMMLVALTGRHRFRQVDVSRLLAERGAVIVDADKIAATCSRPGSPVLDAHGRTFRRATSSALTVARSCRPGGIVFADDAALGDLNAIVHPAMQAEIPGASTPSADTDRVVVLDFPLLRSPKGHASPPTSSSTCRSRWPSQRLVAPRGMDDADTRARINRQIGRAERLARATTSSTTAATSPRSTPGSTTCGAGCINSPLGSLPLLGATS